MLDFFKRLLGLGPKEAPAEAPYKVELSPLPDPVPVPVVENATLPEVINTTTEEKAPAKAKAPRKPKAFLLCSPV